jgi:hypothetical protein
MTDEDGSCVPEYDDCPYDMYVRVYDDDESCR